MGSPRISIDGSQRRPLDRKVMLYGCAAVLGLCILGYIITGAFSTTSPPVRAATAPDQSQKKVAAQHASQPTKRKCEDTCFKANDGVCDEAGRQMTKDYQELLCDLGTDCSDCGEWHGHTTPDAWVEGGPINYLRHTMDVELYVKTTVTKPPLQMIYTHPKKDYDVSAHIHNYGVLEGGITEMFRMVLGDGKCIDPVTGQRKLVLDVGANFGYFAVYSALIGCRVVAWEPVPHFRAILHSLLAINNVTHLVTVRDKVVADVDGLNMIISVPRRGIWGTASVGGINEFPGTEPMVVNVTSERVDSLIQEDVLLMKVDVEGYEPIVFKSAEQLLTQHNVANIVFEYNTGVVERAHETRSPQTQLIIQNPLMLMKFTTLGYKMGLMHDGLAKWPFRGDKFPPLKEITRQMLEYDIKDAHAYTAAAEAMALKAPVPAVLGCPAKQELTTFNSAWHHCLAMPINANPKSFRSSFGFNTNIWASKDFDLLPLAGYAAAFSLEQNTGEEWFVTGDWGMGGRGCAGAPANELVRMRCPCEFSTKANHPVNQTNACKQEAELVMKMLKEQKFVFRDFQYPSQLKS